MAEAVPDAINNYFQAAEQVDLPRLLDCFTEDATVTDEDKSYQGRSEIRDWRETVATVYTYTIEVLGMEIRGPEMYVVNTRLEGDFPGGQVDLQYAFTLRDDLIGSLEIGS